MKSSTHRYGTYIRICSNERVQDGCSVFLCDGNSKKLLTIFSERKENNYARQRHYACKNHRKHKCCLKNIPKDLLEVHVVWVLREFLKDDENLISLAVDISEYYKKLYTENGYIAVLENELKETEKGIANLIKVIEKGVISDAVTSRLEKLEKDKANLKEAMEAEKLKYALAEDENSIKKYFDMYAKADFDDEETRNKILDYFIDKIYVYNDRLVITWWYCDDRTTIELDTLTEITELQDKKSNRKCSTLTQITPLKSQRLCWLSKTGIG